MLTTNYDHQLQHGPLWFLSWEPEKFLFSFPFSFFSWPVMNDAQASYYNRKRMIHDVDLIST